MNDKPKQLYSSRRAGWAILAVALIGGVWFLREYLGVMALAALVTVLSSRLHDKLSSRRRMGRWATPITLLIILFGILTPILLILALAFNDAVGLFANAQSAGWLSPENLQKLADQLTSGLKTIPGIEITKESVRNFVVNAVAQIGPAVINFIIQMTGNIFSFVINAVIFIMLLVLLLGRKKQIVRLARDLSPFDDRIDDEYLQTARSMAVAMVKGTFVIAVVCGTLATVTYWIIGIGNLSFWFVVFTLLSMVPLGAGLVFIPSGILLLLLGQTWQGVLVLAVQFLLINNADNVLRPILVPKEAHLPAVLLLMSAFAGVALFGGLGVIYGPVLMILIYTTVAIFVRHREHGMPMKTPLH